MSLQANLIGAWREARDLYLTAWLVRGDEWHRTAKTASATGNYSIKDGKDGDGAAIGVDVRWGENAQMNGGNGRKVKVGLVDLSGVYCDCLGLCGVVECRGTKGEGR